MNKSAFPCECVRAPAQRQNVSLKKNKIESKEISKDEPRTTNQPEQYDGKTKNLSSFNEKEDVYFSSETNFDKYAEKNQKVVFDLIFRKICTFPPSFSPIEQQSE